jgi:hypothetical protein
MLLFSSLLAVLGGVPTVANDDVREGLVRGLGLGFGSGSYWAWKD